VDVRSKKEKKDLVQRDQRPYDRATLQSANSPSSITLVMYDDVARRKETNGSLVFFVRDYGDEIGIVYHFRRPCPSECHLCHLNPE